MQHFCSLRSFDSFEAHHITRDKSKMDRWASPVALSCGLGASWVWFSVGFAGFLAGSRLFFCGLVVCGVVFFFALLLSYVPKKSRLLIILRADKSSMASIKWLTR